ncbi:MAG: hypothetical protein HXX80_06555 [Nitrososphaerales archaeon]|nr:hypothetical protein [Nitrososphaerales archaeon]
MVLEIFSWAIIAYAFGFLPIAYALMGKGDAGTAFKTGLIPGLVTLIIAFIMYRDGLALGAAGATYVLGATILGIAGMTFTLVGIAGFYTVQAKTLSIVLVFAGLFLVIYGLWYMYQFMSVFSFLTLFLAVFLYGIACLGGGLPAFGMGAKAGGSLIALCSAINFILAISWQFGWIV